MITPIPVAPTNDQPPAPKGPFVTRQSLFSGRPKQIRGGPKNYVVNKNNHYICVDGPIFSLHDADVSPIGSPGKDVLNPLGKPSSSSRCGLPTSGTTRRLAERVQNIFTRAPDRGDVCIMQGENRAVNTYVVIIFVHYIIFWPTPDLLGTPGKQ